MILTAPVTGATVKLDSRFFCNPEAAARDPYCPGSRLEDYSLARTRTRPQDFECDRDLSPVSRVRDFENLTLPPTLFVRWARIPRYTRQQRSQPRCKDWP